LEEQKSLEAALDGIKSELGISNTGKENLKTLMEANEMILKYIFYLKVHIYYFLCPEKSQNYKKE